MGCAPSSSPNTVSSYEGTKESERQKQQVATTKEINSAVPSNPINDKSLSKLPSKRKKLVFSQNVSNEITNDTRPYDSLDLQLN